VTVVEPFLNVSYNSSPYPSGILLAGTQAAPLNTLMFTPYGISNQTLHRLSFRFEGTVGGFGNFAGWHNIGSAKLYQGATLVGQTFLVNMATTTADAVFNFNPPITLPLGNDTNLTIKVDLVNSGSGADATQIKVALKSTSSSDFEVRTPEGGVLPGSYIGVANGNAPSNWFLEHDAAPTIVPLPVTGYHLVNIDDEVARFEVRNYGQVALGLDSLAFNVAAGGLQIGTTTVDRVNNFRLYDDIGNYIAAPLIWRQLSATSSMATTTYTAAGSINSRRSDYCA
jgi:hypothetical protein